MQDYGSDGREGFTAGVDWLQHSLSCCGVVSPSDYQNSHVQRWRHPAHSSTRLEVPLTCCTLLNKGVSLVCYWLTSYK